MYQIEDPRNGEIIYCGKGTGKRHEIHWRLMLADKSTNTLLHRKLTKIFLAGYESPIYHKIFETTDEQLSYSMETFWIAVIGRIDNRT